ncbi:competence protein ComK [Ornithinibacillus halotolerans]|uniref:Competence protein n=1 Tax=Ornithinibacillus halotolerans TaxID=1274357 RepID=A0A916RQU0_9BACI|nr:competence protein ComK [Ornithinibacillus halotolerans]GGA65283.1 hypothetical protein GCM10008025_06420 [Ornithinibacillus halotolerans]
MKEILSSYQVNNHTLALLPAKHTDYYTIVYEQDRTLYITQTPLEIIKFSCLYYFSSYEGRREAVVHEFGYKRKVPISIDPKQNLFTFPTYSPENYNCAWIFYHHIRNIKTATTNPMRKSIITFINEKEVEVDVSTFVLEKQMSRTAICVRRFGKMIG